jgi:large subunit ribosomal protein L4e
MKLPIFNLEKAKVGEIDLPKQFNEEVNSDLIKDAFIAWQSRQYQSKGNKPGAGKKSVAKLSRRRRKYRGSYGLGISRVPRKILSHRGTRFNWAGAFAPGTVGGYRAHPPKSEEILEKKINKKEKKKAFRSALRAVIEKSLVLKRGHLVPVDYPFVLQSSFEGIKKTKEAKSILEKLGFKEELERTNSKKIRAGRGSLRGRKYDKKVGLLMIVSNQCDLIKAAGNIPGVDVVKIDSLNINQLAPGASPGRATIFTDAALNKLKAKK